jgi:hypothetical protein
MEKNPVYLKIGDNIIQSNELQVLQWQWRELQLQDYYQQIFRLTNPQLHSINWASLRLARGRMSPKLRQFSIKLSINWLATGSQLKIYGNLQTKCHLCQEDETNEHLFLCPTRSEQQELLYRHLSTRFQHSLTGSRMIAEFISALRDWAENRPSTSTQDHIQDQTRLVWGLFLRGFQYVSFAKHFDFTEQISTQTGDSWQSDVCYCLTDALYDIWKDLNKQIHGRDPETETNKAREEILAQVQFLYGTKTLMTSNDARDIFSMPLDRRLELSVESNKEWIRQNRPYIHRCIRQWTDKQKKNLQDKREFFKRKKDKPSDSIDTVVAHDSINEPAPVLPDEHVPNVPVPSIKTTLSSTISKKITHAQHFITKWFTTKQATKSTTKRTTPQEENFPV